MLHLGSAFVNYFLQLKGLHLITLLDDTRLRHWCNLWRVKHLLLYGRLQICIIVTLRRLDVTVHKQLHILRLARLCDSNGAGAW